MDIQPGRPMTEVQAALSRETLQAESMATPSSGLTAAHPPEIPPQENFITEIKMLRSRIHDLERSVDSSLDRLMRLEQIIGL